MFTGLVAAVVLQAACVTRPAAALAAAHAVKHSANKAGGAPQWYFYNEVTGEVQFEDPGDTAYEDEETGVRYWYLANGQRVTEDPNRHRYMWIEMYSADVKKPFFWNQETKESTWERPTDLAWRRIRMQDD